MPTEKKKERNRINVVQFDEGVHLQQNYQSLFWISLILLKTENNKIIITIIKLLFTYLALCISLKSLFRDNAVPDARPEKKKKKNAENTTEEMQQPNTTLESLK